MNANLPESVKKVLEERIKSPLWGFIILAWLWFNWPNLAVLFMSDAPVKFRIDYILSQNYFYLRSTVAPVIAGGLLAIITPYAQLLLSKTHKRAEDRHRNNVFMSKSEDVKDAIKLAKLRVQSDRVVETENAKIDANIKAEVERGKREALKTEELEASKQSLLIELKNLEKSIDLHRKEKALIQDLIVKSSSIMDKFFKIDNSSSIQKLKEEIKELYADRGIEMVTIRNKIRDGEELTEQQTMSLIDEVDKTLKR